MVCWRTPCATQLTGEMTGEMMKKLICIVLLVQVLFAVGCAETPRRDGVLNEVIRQSFLPDLYAEQGAKAVTDFEHKVYILKTRLEAQLEVIARKKEPSEDDYLSLEFLSTLSKELNPRVVTAEAATIEQILSAEAVSKRLIGRITELKSASFKLMIIGAEAEGLLPFEEELLALLPPENVSQNAENPQQEESFHKDSMEAFAEVQTRGMKAWISFQGVRRIFLTGEQADPKQFDSFWKFQVEKAGLPNNHSVSERVTRAKNLLKQWEAQEEKALTQAVSQVTQIYLNTTESEEVEFQAIVDRVVETLSSPRMSQGFKDFLKKEAKLFGIKEGKFDGTININNPEHWDFMRKVAEAAAERFLELRKEMRRNQIRKSLKDIPLDQTTSQL